MYFNIKIFKKKNYQYLYNICVLYILNDSKYLISKYLKSKYILIFILCLKSRAEMYLNKYIYKHLLIFLYYVYYIFWMIWTYYWRNDLHQNESCFWHPDLNRTENALIIMKRCSTCFSWFEVWQTLPDLSLLNVYRAVKAQLWILPPSQSLAA